jgi:hypothetical protein
MRLAARIDPQRPRDRDQHTLDFTRQHLAPGAVWLAMKGQHPADEIAALPADVDVFHVEPLLVPGLAAQRCIVWMRRKEGG